MTSEIHVTLLPQYISYTDTVCNNYRLTPIQEAFYHFENLHEITIVIAPTGAGKSFAFPLPIVQFHKNRDPFQVRRKGLIVSPTNALIEDMEEQFQKRFPEVKVKALNSKVLDDLNAKGRFERWKAILRILDEYELVVTNPDLLNFIIFGGYLIDEVRGQRQFTELLEKIDYFVFDEYHLYDEEQIANTFCLYKLSKDLMPGKSFKFFYCSATPERGLERFFQGAGIPYQTLEEKIMGTGRIIHDEMHLQFLKESLMDYLIAQKDLVYAFVQRGERILVLFDRLKELHRALEKFSDIFPDLNIQEESGYTTRSNEQKKLERLEQANLILGTNKLEVGVNLNINVCFMEVGHYYRNFLQRLGRVARGAHKGEVYIFLTPDTKANVKQLEKAFEKTIYDFYSFIETYISLHEDKKFYDEKVPQFIGAFLFAIYKGISKYAYDLKEIFRDQIELEGKIKSFYIFMKRVDDKISALEEINRVEHNKYINKVKDWKDWWKQFLDTFKYFRENKITCKVLDLDRGEDFETEYSLEWILQHKQVVRKEEKKGKVYYVVSGNKEQSEAYAYWVDTLPLHKRVVKKEDYYKLIHTFKKCLAEVLENYVHKQDRFSKQCIDILADLKVLASIMTPKRLNIIEIFEDSNFL